MLKVIMKNIFLKYANNVIDITTPMDFFVIMDTLKQEIICKLKFYETDHDKKLLTYDEKLEDVDFVNEMTITYNNTLSTKLDNMTIVHPNLQYPARNVKIKKLVAKTKIISHY